VIATNIAGTGELVEHGKTGLLVRPSDPDALADAMTRMILDYDFRRSASELGRQKIVEEFDLTQECANLNLFLLESCGAHNRKTSSYPPKHQ
ncbi:MAG TPA: glycosyltransferase, partial [Bryobacteraceae bacterium]|nr:glycosyltransferase [Bryobacteraceae bacterium]